MLLLLISALICQLALFLCMYFGIGSADSEAGSPTGTTPVSIIVAARDEEDSLPGLFRSLESQSYRFFEAMIIDDGSTDATSELLRHQQVKDSRFRYHRIDPGQGKKSALTKGIKRARHDLLVFTDADCRPEPDWLAGHARMHEKQPGAIVAGYGPYARRKGLLNGLVRYETMFSLMLAVTAAWLGRPYTAVGRNLSYSRQIFDEVGGHESSRDLLSGDDDLFVQQAALLDIPVYFLLARGTFTLSSPPVRWKDWIRQKRRHLSTGWHYQVLPLLGLALFHSTSILCWLAPFLWWGGPGLVLLGGRMVALFGVVHRVTNLLGERRIRYRIPDLDLLYNVYNLLAPLLSVRRLKRW